MKTRNLIQICLLCAAMLQALSSGAQPVTQIAAGNFHILFLKSDGSLWAMGLNANGQLGDGTFNTTNQPEQIVASNVTAIAAGWEHSLFLKSDGSLWGMGAGPAIGLGRYGNTNSPAQIEPGNFTAIAAGRGFSLFLSGNGSVFATGNNQFGQFGDGTYNDTTLPKQIVARGATTVATGWSHTLFLTTIVSDGKLLSDGSLWTVGRNWFGELGDGVYNNVSPYGTNQPQEIVASNVTAIAGGEDHSLFLKSDGSSLGHGPKYRRPVR